MAAKLTGLRELDLGLPQWPAQLAPAAAPGLLVGPAPGFHMLPAAGNGRQPWGAATKRRWVLLQAPQLEPPHARAMGLTALAALPGLEQLGLKR